MGKYSNFERNPRDFYKTPIKAVEPLIDHLPYEEFDYVEPCAGDGELIRHIVTLTGGQANCIFASDIEPQCKGIAQVDALDIEFNIEHNSFTCITNPPWEREFLHSFIDRWLDICDLWLLFDADWMHTKQSAALMTYCAKVVSVGRVKWIEGSKGVGKENCCWYNFKRDQQEPTQFFGRLVDEKLYK